MLKSKITFKLKCSEAVFLNRLSAVIEPWQKDNSDKLFIGTIHENIFSLQFIEKRQGSRGLNLIITGRVEINLILLEIDLSRLNKRLLILYLIVAPPIVGVSLFIFPYQIILIWLFAWIFMSLTFWLQWHNKLDEIRRIFKVLSIKE